MTRRRLLWLLLAAGVILPLIAVLSLGTPVGRPVLRWAVEQAANASLRGTLTIGRIEGSPFNTLRLFDVALVNEQGATAAAVGRLEVEHRFSALLAGAVHVRRVDVRGLSVDWPVLASTFPPPTKTATAPAAGDPFPVTVDNAYVEAAKIAAAPDWVFEDVRLAATATIGPEIAATLRRLSGTRRGVAWAARGAVGLSGDEVRQLDLAAAVGDIRVALRRAPKARSPIDVEGTLRWSAGAWSALLDATVLPGRADLALRVKGRPARLEVSVDGAIGGGRVAVRATGPRPPLALSLRAEALDPSRLYSSAPPGRLDLTVTASAGALDPLGAHARAQLRGKIQPAPGARAVHIAAADLRGDAAGDQLDVRASVQTDVGALDANARLRSLFDAVVIESAHARVRRVGLDRASAGAVAGTLTATVTAQGDASAPSVQADLGAAGLTAADTRLGELAVRGLRVAVARSTGPRVGLTWDELQWRAPAATWTSTKGAVRLEGGRLRVGDLTLRSRRGTVRASGDLELAKPLGATSRAEIRIDRLDLAALAGLVPAPPGFPRGMVDGRARLDGAQRAIELALTLAQGAWHRRVPPLDATLDAAIAPDRATADVVAGGRRWGIVRVNAVAAPPADHLAPGGWTEAGWAVVRRLDARVDLSLAPFLGLAGLADTASVAAPGRLDGSLRIGPAGRTLDLALIAGPVRLRGYPELTGLTVTATGTARGLGVEAALRVAGRPALRAHGHVDGPWTDVPARPWTGWRGDVRASIDRFPLGALDLSLPGSPAGSRVGGDVSMTLRGRRAGDERVRLTLTGHDLRVVPELPPVTVRLAAAISGGWSTAGPGARFAADLTAAGAELGRHRIQVAARQPDGFAVPQLLDRIDALSVDSTGLSLTALRAFGAPSDLAGQVRAEVRATPGLRTWSATVTADRVLVTPTLAESQVNLHVRQTSGGVVARSQVSVGGRAFLDARASAPVDVRKALVKGALPSGWSLEGRARADDYPLNQALAPGVAKKTLDGRVSLRVDVRGPAVAPTVTATATLRALRVGSSRFDRVVAEHFEAPGRRFSQAELLQPDERALRVRVDATDTAAVRVDAQARRFDLGFLAGINRLTDVDVGIDGELDGDLRLATGPSEPTAEGALTLRQLRLVLPAGPPIEEGQLDIALTGRGGRATLKARSGVGRLSADISGRTDPLSLDGRFALDDVQIIGGGQVVSIDLSGTATGRDTPEGFDAEVLLGEGLIRLPDESADDLHPVNTYADVVTEPSKGDEPRRPGSTTRPIKVLARSTRAIGIRGGPIDAVAQLNVLAKTDPRGLILSGDARLEQGTITLFGRRYNVERALVTIGGRLPVEPRIDVLLTHDFSACRFSIALTGPVDDPKLRLSAEPDIYDDRQLLGFLFGASPDEDNPDKTPEQQGIDTAAGLLLGQLQDQLKKRLPIDTLAVDLGDGANSGQANVTLGKWLTDKLFLAYTYRYGAGPAENASEGMLRYRFLSSWLLELVFGDRGNGGADVLWIRRW